MLIKKTAAIIASCGGLGRARCAPGTVASAVAMLTYAALSLVCSWAMLVVATVLFSVAGFWATEKSIVTRVDDPAWIVIDEWVAVWSMCLFLPSSLLAYIIAFIVFRILDIAKPWPVSYAQQFPGAWGIFCDDFMAAFLAAIFLCCVVIPVIL